MTPESEALLNALVPAEGSVTTDRTEAIYALTEPIHEMLDRVDAELQEIDRLRRAADRSEDDPTVFGWFERFKNTVDAGRRMQADAKRAIEDISDLCFQLDRYALEMRDTVEGRREAASKLSATKIVMHRDEVDALRETARVANEELGKALSELNAIKDKGKP